MFSNETAANCFSQFVIKALSFTDFPDRSIVIYSHS